MKLRLTPFISAAIFSLGATMAQAQDPVPPGDNGFTVYGEVEGWTVFVDIERETCLIERADDMGHVVQMGLTKNHKHGYIGVFTAAPTKIKRKERIEIVVDGALFKGKGHGLKSHKIEGGKYSGGYFIVKDENMVTAVQNGQTMVVFPKRTAIFEVDLTGTKKAIDEARKCNLDQAKG